MSEAIELLRKLRAAASATAEQVHKLVQTCEQCKVPRVTIYCFTWSEGWYDMRSAYVLTARPDATDHVWYFSPRSGLHVYDREGKNGMPFEQWDPQADLFTDDSFYEGATNMNPAEREKLERERRGQNPP